MMEAVLGLERKFWLEGAEFYRRQLADDFVMLFPGIGLLGRAEAIEGVEGGRRWTDVEIRDPRILDLGPHAQLLCYEAKARRNGEAEYSALVSSVYRRRDGTWKLAFHQQSPIG